MKIIKWIILKKNVKKEFNCFRFLKCKIRIFLFMRGVGLEYYKEISIKFSFKKY